MRTGFQLGRVNARAPQPKAGVGLWRWLWVGLLGVCSLGVGGSIALAAPGDISKEYRIKAAFLYNFTKFVEWPAGRFSSDEAPVLIGVLGRNPFGTVLEETVEGRTVNGRPVRVVLLDSAQRLAEVHVVFMAEGSPSCREEFAKAPDAGVLTVGECEEDAACGAVINFLTVGDKVRFEISIPAAEARGLKLSAHLQKLAMTVHRATSN